MRQGSLAYRRADSLQLLLRIRQDSDRSAALVSEDGLQRASNGLDVLFRHAKRGRGVPDLLDKVANLERVERHELVHVVHARDAGVGRVAGLVVLCAAEKGAEVLVEMRQEFAGTIKPHFTNIRGERSTAHY